MISKMIVNDTQVVESPSLDELNSAELKRLWPTFTFLVVLSLTGIIGNSLVVYVYRPKRTLSNSKYFILCLSALDLFSCCVAIPIDIAIIAEQYIFAHAWLCKLSRFVNVLGICSSCFLLLFIAIDRFRKVCRPLRWQMTSTIAKILSLLAVFLSLLLAWPVIIVFGSAPVLVVQYNITGTECDVAVEIGKTPFMTVYVLVFGLLFTVGIIIVSILYCLIGHEIRRQTKKINRLTRLKPPAMPHDLTSCSMFDSNELSKIKETDKKTNVLCKTRSVRNKTEVKRLSEPKSENESADTGYFGSATCTCNTQSIEIYLEKEEKEETNVSNAVQENSKNIAQLPGYNELKAQPQCLEAIISGTPSIFSMTEDNETNNQAVSNTASTTKGNRIERSQSCQTLTSHYLKQAKTKRISLLMFSITLASILSFVPHLTLVLIRNIYTDFVVNLSDTERAVYNLFYKSFFLNCAVNPVMYNFFDSRFRQSVKGIFIRNCKRNAILPDACNN